jgi:FkbM family methyltransferase
MARSTPTAAPPTREPLKTTLPDGTEVYCLLKSEALVLDHHIHGYLTHGIEIRAGDVVFDVGGNIGLFGVRAFQRCNGDVTVYAFEPVPPTYEVMRRNFEALGSARMVPMSCGLSRAAGTATFQYYPNSPALSTAHPEAWSEDPKRLEKAVQSNLANPPPEMAWAKWLPSFLSRFVARHLQRGAVSFTCELRTVSQIMREAKLSRIDLLKVDCEGAELEVLLGIEPADWPHIGAVVAEVHDLEGRLGVVRDLLLTQGFTKLAVEQEGGMEDTGLYNIFATRG